MTPADRLRRATEKLRGSDDPDLAWLGGGLAIYLSCPGELALAAAIGLEHPPCRPRLTGRDDCIRAALQLYAGAPSARAKALERDLADYLGRAWLRERELPDLPGTTSETRSALHAIARANDGRAIGWRQILNISSGTRGR